MNPYIRFGIMIAVSTVAMFGLMYLNTYQLQDVHFSETRTYMALVMGATMAVIMLVFMLHMYTQHRLNIAILLGSAGVFAMALWLVRTQSTVEDVSYMKAMIPHHSIAILTSERARISDPRVRKLADEIIESQRQEIQEMKALIAELQKKGG
jgi:FlaA1/EpsC-like NDP-sugar epimerase